MCWRTRLCWEASASWCRSRLVTTSSSSRRSSSRCAVMQSRWLAESISPTAAPTCPSRYLSARTHLHSGITLSGSCTQCVVDGDLCEMFHRLPADRKRSIAEEMDRTVSEQTKKLED